MGADATAQIDHVLDSDDSNEDYMDPMMDNLCWIIQQSEIQTLRRHGHRQGHRQVPVGPPPGGWTATGPHSRPVTCHRGKCLYV